MNSESETDISDHSDNDDYGNHDNHSNIINDNADNIHNMFNSMSDIKKIDKIIRKNPNVVNKYDKEGNTLLITACTYGNCELVKYLLTSLLYVDVDHKNDYGESALQISEAFGHSEITQIIKFYINKSMHSSTNNVILCQ